MNKLQYINITKRESTCWSCLEQMVGKVPNTYRYHAECYFQMTKMEEPIVKRRKGFN